MGRPHTIINAQAELQSALGLYRLEHGRGDSIENCMTNALAGMHQFLEDEGYPMLEGANRRSTCPACEDTPVGFRWLCPNLANHEKIA
jgi:hypothetical protein